jgi:hypothetical protein
MSNGTVGRPQRRLDFQRQYDPKPARCQRITVSGRTIASASYILGNSRQTPPNISLSIEMKRGLLGRVRRNTLICCLKTRISASSATRDRSRSITIPKISLHKSNIEQQHRLILDQPPAGWGLRQGQAQDGASYREKSTSHSQELKGCEIAALDLAIPRRWLWPQESGACVKFTPAGADVFA